MKQLNSIYNFNLPYDLRAARSAKYSLKYRIQQEILCMGSRVESVENDISFWLISNYVSILFSFPASYTRRILNFDHR